MPGETFDITFKGDPSDAVQAAQEIAQESNKIADADKKRDGILASINGRLSTMAKTATVAAVAAAGIGLLKLKERIGEYEKLSRAIEVSYEKAQELAIAERDAGLEVDAVRSAIEGLAEAQAGFDPELRRLGFTLEEIRSSRPDELFDILSKRLNSGEMSARQFDAAVKILGKNGGEVALALKGGFESFRETARESGRIISDESFGKLIGETDYFLAQLKVMGDDILKLITPFETFSEAVQKSLGKVNEIIEGIRFSMSFTTNYIGARLGGLSDTEATEFASGEATDSVQKAKDRAKQVNDQRGSRESLEGEQNAGLSDLLKQMESRFSDQSDIGTLQRVGLAATGGESAAIKIARSQNGKLQTLINESVRQTQAIRQQ